MGFAWYQNFQLVRGSGRLLTCSKGVTPTSYHQQPSNCSHGVGEAWGRGHPSLGLDPLPCACLKVQSVQPREGVLVGLSASHDVHALLSDCSSVGVARLRSIPCKPGPSSLSSASWLSSICCSGYWALLHAVNTLVTDSALRTRSITWWL